DTSAANGPIAATTIDGTGAGTENLTLKAGTAGTSDITISGNLGTGTRLGVVTITSANDVTESADLRATSLTQSTGTGTTTFNGALNTTGAFDVTTNAIVFGGGGSATAGASSTLTADNMDLAGRPISVGGNRLTLRPSTAGRVIDLGTDTAGRLGPTTTEMAGITGAGVLQIGDSANTGGVVLTANTNTPATAPMLSVVTGAGISQSGGTLTAPSLGLTSGTGIGSSGNRLSVNATTLSAQTTSGGIYITETDSVALGTVDTQTNLSAAGGAADVTLVAGGAITQSAGSLAGNNVRLEAGTEIGASGNSLSTRAGTLAAKTTTSGGVFISEDSTGGALTIGTADGVSGVSTASNGSIDIRTVGGSLTVNNAVTADGSGAVNLEAGGSGSNLTVAAPVSSGSGNLTLTANTNVDLSNAAADLTTGGTGSITVRAINGSLLMAEEATIQTAAGRIALESYGAMTISNTSLISSSGDMYLTSDTAGIEMGVANTGGIVTLTAATTIGNNNGSTTDVTASVLTATAGTSITLDTAVGTASLTGPGSTRTTGDITLSNTGGPLKLTSVQSGGDIKVTNATGVMTLGQVEAAGFVDLANLNGAIMGGSFSPAVIAGTGATLSAKGASGVVGDSGNALGVKVMGGIFTIQAGGTSGSVSGNINAVSLGGRAPDTIDTPSPVMLDGRLTDPYLLSATQQAGQAVAAISASAQAQSAFEAVESQIIEVVGDPSEQIEEELRMDEEVSPSDSKEDDERKQKRGKP
ncbi:MAG: hypothetical protein NTW68_07530, partial [candidate division NC10 bacterium]|nr:hypothetical protein [candidate division NC10 bacterium]